MTPPDDAFGVGPTPHLEPRGDLLSKLQGTTNGTIGYLVNDRAKAIYVIDLSKEEYLGKLEFVTNSTGGGPIGIAISQDGLTLFVTRSSFSNDVLVIDSESLELVKKIPCGLYNRIIVPNYVRSEAYVLTGHRNDKNIYVLDLESWEIDEVIGFFSKRARNAALSQDSDTLYVTDEDGFLVLDLETREVVERVNMNTTWWKRIVVHPSGDRA